MGGDNFNKSGISFHAEQLNEYYTLLQGDLDNEKWQEMISKQHEMVSEQENLAIEKWWDSVEQFVLLKIMSKKPSIESTIFINPVKTIQSIPIFPAGYDEKINRFLKTKIPGLAISSDLENFYFCNFYFITQEPKISVSRQSIEGIIEAMDLNKYSVTERETIFDYLREVPKEHSRIIIQSLEKLVHIFDSYFEDLLERVEKRVKENMEVPKFGMNEIEIHIGTMGKDRIISQILSLSNNARTEIQNFLDTEFVRSCTRFMDSISRDRDVNFPRFDMYRHKRGIHQKFTDLELIPVFLRYIRARMPKHKISLVATNGDITQPWLNHGEIKRMGPRDLRLRVELQTR